MAASKSKSKSKIKSMGAKHHAREIPRIPDLELLRCIGHGAYGEVWLARNILGTYRAIKIIDRKAFRDEEAFEREFSGLQRFEPISREHDGFVEILHVGRNRADGFFYYVMELADDDSNPESIRGIDPGTYVPKTLSNELGRCGRLSVTQSVQLGLSLSEALAELHRHGLVHRDVKPSNIIFVKGHPKLADIGLVAQAGEKRRLGTEGYIPPEGPGKPQADLYSLGKVLYEASTGTDRLDYPDLPADFDTMAERETFLKLNSIILKACDNDIRKRYRTATEINDDLAQLGVAKPVQAVRSRLPRNPISAFSAVLLAVLVAAVGVFVWKGELIRPPRATGIAVLPFENLSDDKQHSFFADGVQDEILSDLAKIADLRVISRTSVMQYKGGIARNLREIGRQLGVAHVVEGSVQWSGNRVRVKAQLIDARTDRHLWGQTYDRNLSDVFAIQSEIAKTIAEQLQAKLSPAEKNAIERPPTSDVPAFDLYTRAKNLLLDTTLGSDNKTNLLQGAELLNQAIARDPSFFDAYCQLAWAHDFLYLLGHDHTPARLALAEAAIQAAFRLRPDAGEAHLARAWNLYWGYLAYEDALAEVETAGQTLPNDPRLFQLKAFIERRQGHWEEAIRNFERASTLDPRNVFTLQQIARSYEFLRRYAEEEVTLDRILAIDPNDAVTKAERALVQLNWQADTRLLHETIDSIRAANPAGMPEIADAWLMCGLGERDADAAKNALIAFGENRPNPSSDSVSLTRLFLEGVIARMIKDDAKARSAFIAARAEQEKTVQAQPDYGPALCVLGLIDAGLGRKEEALREGRRAVELLPVEKDAINGPAMIKYLAMIAAWAGDNDLACEQLATAIRLPNSPSYGQLKLLPFWDPLRGDPRFEEIVASLAPK
jgi:TolB-like protein